MWTYHYHSIEHFIFGYSFIKSAESLNILLFRLKELNVKSIEIIFECYLTNIKAISRISSIHSTVLFNKLELTGAILPSY